MKVRLQPQRLGKLAARLRKQPVGFLPHLRRGVVGQCSAPVVERSMIVGLQPQRLSVLAARLRKQPVGLPPSLRLGLVGQRSTPVVERLKIVAKKKKKTNIQLIPTHTITTHSTTT